MILFFLEIFNGFNFNYYLENSHNHLINNEWLNLEQGVSVRYGFYIIMQIYIAKSLLQ